MKNLSEIPGHRASASPTIGPARPVVAAFEEAMVTSRPSLLMLWMRTIPVLALILFYAMQAHATTLLKKSLADLLSESDGIVVGTVTDLKSQYDKKKGIQTFVTLTDLKVIHGQYAASSLVIQLPGGEIEGDVLDVHGSPRFEPNDRVVLFVKGNGVEMVPIVGWTQGVFRVFHDEKTGSERIKDHEGNHVFGVSGDELVKEQVNLPEAEIVDLSANRGGNAGSTDDGSGSESLSPKKKDPKGEAMTSRDFLNAISGKLKEKSLKGKRIASVSPESFSQSDVSRTEDAVAPKSAQ